MDILEIVYNLSRDPEVQNGRIPDPVCYNLQTPIFDKSAPSAVKIKGSALPLLLQNVKFWHLYWPTHTWLMSILSILEFQGWLQVPLVYDYYDELYWDNYMDQKPCSIPYC